MLSEFRGTLKKLSGHLKLIAVLVFANFMTAGASDRIDVQEWLRGAKALTDDKIVNSGLLFTEMVDSIRPTYGIRSPFDEELSAEGFSKVKDGAYLAELTEGGSARLQWRFSRSFSGRVFLRVEHRYSPAFTGDELLAIYHNNAKLADIRLGNRQTLKYSFPYIWSLADQQYEVPMELNFNPHYGHAESGYTIRSRRMFNVGDTLSVIAEKPGFYAVKELMLVPQPDTIPVLHQTVLYPEVRLWRNGKADGDTQFAWVTRLPSRCVLLWSRNKAELESGIGERWESEVYAENHQHFTSMSLKSGENIYYRILAEGNDGSRVASEVFSYTVSPAPVQKASGRIALKPVEKVPVGTYSVQSGIPFAKGVLTDVAYAALVVEGGNAPIPAQLETVSRYPDGSVRWLAAYFKAEPGKRYELLYSPVAAKRTASGFKVSENDGRVLIEGNGMTARFDRRQAGGLAELSINGVTKLDPDKISMSMSDASGGHLPAGIPEVLKVELDGSQAVTVTAQGHFRDGKQQFFEYIARWTLRNGFPGIHLELSVGNDLPERLSRMYDHKKTISYFKNAYIDLESPTGAEFSLLTPTGGRIDPGKGDWRMLQADENRMVSFKGDARGATTADRLDGVVIGDAGRNSFAIGVQDFWQQYPKSYEFASGRLRIGLMPDFPADLYPKYPDQVDAEYLKLFFYLVNGKYRFMHGIRKTHRISFAFGEQAAPAVSSDRILGSAVFYAPDPRYAAATGVFGLMSPVDKRNKLIDKWLSDGFELYLKNRVKNREYGLLNFGDWFGERGVNWGNLEYDLGQGASQQFLRTGEPIWLRTGYEAAVHQAEIDTVQYGRNAGLQMQHAGGHTGREYFLHDGAFTMEKLREIVKERFIPYNQTFHAGHMWIGGITNYASMLNSFKLQNLVEMFGQTRGRIATIITNGYDQRGWNLLAFANLYAYDGNPFYLNAARITLDRYEISVDDIAGTVYPHLYEHPYVSYVHRNAFLIFRDVSGESRVNDVFVRSLKALDTMWDDEVEGFVTPEHGWWYNRRDEPIYTRVLAEAYLLTGDKKWLERLRIHLADGLGNLDQRSKSFSINLLFAPLWTSALDRVGLHDIAVRPEPAALRKVRTAGGRGGITADTLPQDDFFHISTWADKDIQKYFSPDSLRDTSSGANPFSSQRILRADGGRKVAGFFVKDKTVNNDSGTTRLRLYGASFSGSARNKDNRSTLSLGVYKSPDGAMDISPENSNLILGVEIGNRQHLFVSSVPDPADADHVRAIWTGASGALQSETRAMGEKPLVLPFPTYASRAASGPIILELEISGESLVFRVLDGVKSTEQPQVFFQSEKLAISQGLKGVPGVRLTADAVPGQSVCTVIGKLEIK